MVQKNNLRLSLFIFVLVTFISAYPASAEVKVFDKVTKWCASKDQSPSQAEQLAVLEAQQQAIEEAGVFISSLTVVKDYKLEKDEITRMASAILQTKRSDADTELFIENKTYCVRVRTVIQVDTSTLNPQIEAFMKDKGAQKKANEDAKTIRELKEQMANLKSSDVKHWEAMTAQALAVEREKDKQRLLMEEQTLKAKGELSRAQAERFAIERENQEKISRTLAEQEKTKREEAATLAAEQDRVKRAQLENEQRWNDLARKSQLAQDQWGVIDDSLSLKQALTEVTDLKREIANLKKRLDFQYNENEKNMKHAYAQQRALSTAKMPSAPAPKDAFESTSEYNARISAYEQQVRGAQRKTNNAVEILKKEETLKLAEAKVDYLGQQIRVLAPFVQRLQKLQERKFILPEGGTITVSLGEPDADNDRFPLHLQYKGKSWSVYWEYNDRETAKDFYKTRTYLKAEGLFQIEEDGKPTPILTEVRVTHPGTKETREFHLEKPVTFREIDQFAEFQQDESTATRQVAKFQQEKATDIAVREKEARMLARKVIGNDGRFVAYDDGTVLDKRSGLMWASKDNDPGIFRKTTWDDAVNYCLNYRGGGYTDWRMPTLNELEGLYDRSIEDHKTKLISLSMSLILASDRGAGNAYFNFYRGSSHWSDKYTDYSGTRAIPVRSAK